MASETAPGTSTGCRKGQDVSSRRIESGGSWGSPRSLHHLQLPAPGLDNALWWRTRKAAVDPGADVPSTAASSQGAPAGLRKKPAQSADPHHVPLPRADVIVADASALTSKRQRTALRFNMNLYKWRHFVDTDEEAVLGQSHGMSQSFAVQAVCLSPCCARNICVRVSA